MSTHQFLCYAWGESDKPVAQVVKTREQVRQFLIDQWMGEESQELREVMCEFDATVWPDESDKLQYTFEIGGCYIERVFEASLKPDVVPTWNSALDAAIRIVDRKCGCGKTFPTPAHWKADRLTRDGDHMIQQLTELKLKETP